MDNTFAHNYHPPPQNTHTLSLFMIWGVFKLGMGSVAKMQCQAQCWKVFLVCNSAYLNCNIAMLYEICGQAQFSIRYNINGPWFDILYSGPYLQPSMYGARVLIWRQCLLLLRAHTTVIAWTCNPHSFYQNEAWTCPPLEPIVLVFWSHRVVVSSVFSLLVVSPWLRFGKLIYRMKSDQMCLLCRFWRWKAHGCSWWVASVAVLYIRLLYVLILTWTCWSPSDNLLSPSLPLLTEDLNWLTMQI
jgi:hypothetical protein